MPIFDCVVSLQWVGDPLEGWVKFNQFVKPAPRIPERLPLHILSEIQMNHIAQLVKIEVKKMPHGLNEKEIFRELQLDQAWLSRVKKGIYSNFINPYHDHPLRNNMLSEHLFSWITI